MTPILRAQPPAAFDVPPGIVFRDVDPRSGLLPTSACPVTIREAYLAGTEPDRPCVARPALLPPSRDFREVFEEPARLFGDWMRQARRFFERRSPPRPLSVGPSALRFRYAPAVRVFNLPGLLLWLTGARVARGRRFAAGFPRRIASCSRSSASRRPCGFSSPIASLDGGGHDAGLRRARAARAPPPDAPAVPIGPPWCQATALELTALGSVSCC